MKHFNMSENDEKNFIYVAKLIATTYRDMLLKFLEPKQIPIPSFEQLFENSAIPKLEDVLEQIAFGDERDPEYTIYSDQQNGIIFFYEDSIYANCEGDEHFESLKPFARVTLVHNEFQWL